MFVIFALAAIGILLLFALAPLAATAGQAISVPLVLAALTAYRLVSAAKSGRFGKLIRTEKPVAWRWSVGFGWTMVSVIIGEFIYSTTCSR